MTRYSSVILRKQSSCILLLLPILFILCFGRYSYAETIYLSVAASMTDAVKEVISTFSSSQPKARILANFGSSGSLAKQISQGAPSHLYISANPRWMDYLVENKIIEEQSKKILAHNSLVFISRSHQQIDDLTELKGMARIAIGSPGSVPAGQYAREALEAAGVYSYLENHNILVMAKDVRQALLYADRGEVDGAFVYKTDAILAKNATIALTVPESLYSSVVYPVALTPKGEKSELAKEFFKFLTSSEGGRILSTFGFASPGDSQ